VTNVPKLRYWSHLYHNTPLRDCPLQRKPDVVLLDVDHRENITWSCVRAVTEVTSLSYKRNKINITIRDKSYITLLTQANRVFVPILAFWGNKFQLTVTDREGQLCSHDIQITGYRPFADSLFLLRAIAALCFAAPQHIGYDPTMITDRAGKVESIICDEKTFKVVKLMYEMQSLTGRGTRVWQVEHCNTHYILKDAWVEKLRPVAEYEHLQHIAGVKGVSELFCFGDVMIDGRLLFTGNIREGLGTNPERGRIRRRIVTCTIGSHIATFRSKYELISAFRDLTISTPWSPSPLTLY
jgi:hypothetical protein